ncbi:MAG: hypothetical protein AAFR16_12905 [Pseudomonadota bacterium]
MPDQIAAPVSEVQATPGLAFPQDDLQAMENCRASATPGFFPRAGVPTAADIWYRALMTTDQCDEPSLVLLTSDFVERRVHANLEGRRAGYPECGREVDLLRTRFAMDVAAVKDWAAHSNLHCRSRERQAEIAQSLARVKQSVSRIMERTALGPKER